MHPVCDMHGSLGVMREMGGDVEPGEWHANPAKSLLSQEIAPFHEEFVAELRK